MDIFLRFYHVNYNAEVLHTAKHQAKRKKLDFKRFSHPMLSVLEMKGHPEYSESLKEIAIDKMYVMYWLPTQISLYKSFIKKDEIGSICIDATGGLVKTILTMDNSRRVILLYQIETLYDNKSLPLSQFVTEKHDANTLAYWIREWIRVGIPAPKQIVSDCSFATIKCVCISF